MGHMVPIERDLTIDIESGATTSEDEGSKDPEFEASQEKGLLGRIWGSLIKDKENVSSSNNVLHSSDVSTTDMESLLNKSSGEDSVALFKNKGENENRKKTSSRKAPKPPRPPKGPSLDAADQKLVKEISELAMLKRARVDRMRERKKKKKAGKTGSSSSSLCALIVTILFILVIIFQGILSSVSSNASFDGSPGSSAVSTEPFISVQFYKNISERSHDGPAPGSESPNMVEQVSGSSSDDENVWVP